MSDVKKGGAPSGRTRGKYAGLVLAAKAEPGEWFSQELDDKTTPNNVYSKIFHAVGRVMAEVTIRDGTIWVRFYTDD